MRILLGLALLCASSASALAKKPVIDIEEFRPGQMEIGLAAVEMYVSRWKKEAADAGVTLDEYARTTLRPKFARTTLPTVIDSGGHYRNTDGHHRVSALREITKLTGVHFVVKLDVLKDYTGWSFADFARHFVNKLGKGQFTEEVEKLDVVERVRHLPDSYAELRNNVLRSTFEAVFSRMGLKGNRMKNYFDFHVARKSVDLGLIDALKKEGVLDKHATEVPAHLALDHRVVDVALRMFEKPKLAKYLVKKAVDKRGRKSVRRALAKI